MKVILKIKYKSLVLDIADDLIDILYLKAQGLRLNLNTYIRYLLTELLDIDYTEIIDYLKSEKQRTGLTFSQQVNIILRKHLEEGTDG